MRTIYFKIKDLLKTVPSIKYIDLDYGQLEVPNPAVNFPCALIKITYPKCEDLQGKTQRVKCRIEIKLGFKMALEKTASIYTDEAIAQNLSYFDTVEAAYSILQGYTDDEVEELTRTAMSQPQYYPGLLVTEMPFETEFDDETAED